MLNLNDYDYPFDNSLIAQYPLPKRDQSRLLVLNRTNAKTGHRIFADIGEYLRDGDLLVLNNTRVIPCRIIGEKAGTGGRVELLLLKRYDDYTWEAIAGKKLRDGVKINLSDSLWCMVRGKHGSNYIIEFPHISDLMSHLSEIGQMPVPPYIKREPCSEDKERYQTVYADKDGAIAAPTAGLHFTDELIDTLKCRGVSVVYITLHVGIGTFRPVKTEFIGQHKMEPEWFSVSKDAAGLVSRTRESGGRVIAVGTTSVRALEQAAISGQLRPSEGETGLFIYPGFKFNAVDAMITNFHLPKSTLLMLVMAFAGRKGILESYAEAVAQKYRFYSYGDAMLII